MMTQETETLQIDLQQVDYTGMSGTYDEQRFRGMKNEYHEALRRRIVLKQVGENDKQREILDVGCGTGRGLLYLASAGFRNLTGLDYTSSMLDRARAKLAECLPNRPVALFQGDAFSLPFDADSFDAVVSLNFFHLFRLQKQKELIRQLHRVCRPGGRVVVEFENLHKGFYMTRYLEQRRHCKTTKLNTFREVKEIFSDSMFDSLTIVGTDLPAVHRVLKRLPRIGLAVESITQSSPFNRFGGRFVVAGRRRE